MTPSPHGRPSADELLEALKEWLERDVAAVDDARVAFHARVAVNIVEMVRREHALAGDVDARHAEMLASFGVADEAELAASIRNGDHDADLDGVLERLRPTVEDKVRVANPRYLS
jgi:hypothetical protein